MLGCSTLDPPNTVVPAVPAVENLPCVRRLSDGALFIALIASAMPLDWPTLPSTTWSHLSTNEWAECSPDEAALVAHASSCSIVPI